MTNVIKQTINIFPKTLPFFTILFNQANDVYVKIYETTQLNMFYVFLNKKTTKLGTGCKDTLVICNSIFFIYRVTDDKPLMLYLAYFLSDLNK
jgi:hypothetical protein